MKPLYLEQLTPNNLKSKSEKMNELLRKCEICPNNCNVDRTAGETGLCHSTLPGL